jgi:hypothetical protein
MMLKRPRSFPRCGPPERVRSCEAEWINIRIQKDMQDKWDGQDITINILYILTILLINS